MYINMSEPTPNYEPTPEPIGLPYGLTPQEFNELKQATFGLTRRQAAESRWVSEETSKVHRAHIFQKMDVQTIAEAASKVISDGIIPVEKTKQNGLTDSLTPREHDVLELLVKGLSNSSIAEELGISFETAKSHVRHILPKLDAHNRVHAVRRIYEYGLLEIPLNPDQLETSANVVPIGVGRAAVVLAHGQGEYPTPPAA
jgi:DNA-binding CsgD family transcriptional regulator